MVTVKATFNESGTASPEIQNKLNFGSLFDGEKYLYFESDEERETYLNSLIIEETPQNNFRVKEELKETETETILETKNNMQVHENTNVEKPVIIGKRPFYKSKKYRLNTLDCLKGFLIASLTSALFVVQQLADGGTLSALNYKPVLMAAISGGVGYLIKNFFTDSKKNEK